MKFSIVCTVSGIRDVVTYHESCYIDFIRFCESHSLPFDETEMGDSEYSYLAEEGSSNEWWERWGKEVQDFQFSGILDKEQMKSFICETGCFASDCETMGTLGGPLAPWGGIVPDVVLENDSSCIIVSCRVTPFCEKKETEYSERDWDRIKNAFINWCDKV